MSFWTLIFRSLKFYARAHLGVVLGAAVGSAALVGALVVGDSVRLSLRDMAVARLGRVDFAMASGDRLFRAQLAGDVLQSTRRFTRPANAVLNRPLPASTSVLQLAGTATAADGSARANRVQILGVNEDFWQMADKLPAFNEVSSDAVALNEALARQLKVKAGETILLRVEKPSLLSRDAPISSQNDSSVALRLRVEAIVSDKEFGRFGLQANQIAPFNAFVNLSQLQEKVGQRGRANLMLFVSVQDKGAVPQPGAHFEGTIPLQYIDAPFLDMALHLSWQLADAQLELRDLLEGGGVELRSSRVFLDPAAVEAARKISTNAAPILTYFVNELRDGSNSTPYSMVTAMGAPVVPADMRDDEILINDWLAEDLNAQAGDKLALSYFVIGNGRALEERTNEFRVHGVVPLAGAAADRGLMPDFPGLAQADSSSDWDAGFPIQMKKIRPKDEQYWKQHRGTPKAFVTLAAGEKMWKNRFGDFTAMRFPKSAGTKETIDAALRKNISPASVGLEFQPVREQALAASSQSMDFGGLFIGFSLFLIVAALLLMALLFQFGLEQRAVEIGTLLALGFRPRQVRRLFLREGAMLALAGGILGAAGGVLYAKAMLLGLTTIWRSAVGTSALQYHATAETLVIGTLASTVVGVATIWLALRRQARRPARELLAGETAYQSEVAVSGPFLGGQSGEFSTRNALMSQKGEMSDGRSPSPQPSPPGRARTIWPRWAQMGGRGFSHGSGAGSNIRPRSGKRGSRGIWIGPIAAVCALGLILEGVREGANSAAETFFGAGALLLIAGLGFAAVWLAYVGRRKATTLTLGGLGLSGCGRRRNRSLATIALLGCGVFLIVAIGAFRIDANSDAQKRSSGTGGFALIGESALPVTYDLNSAAGREFYGLNSPLMKDVKVVAFRVHDGDEASCLNLNRAQTPRVLGVNAEELQKRGAFTFAEEIKQADGKRGWDLLKRDPSFSPTGGEGARRADEGAATEGKFDAASPGRSPLTPALSPSEGEREKQSALQGNSGDSVRETGPGNNGIDVIPAIGDENSILWAMGKKVGDTVDYTDARGRAFKLRLVGAVANSMLQGSLIIDEAEFVKRFPDESGYRMFLVDAPTNSAADVAALLTRSLQDAGLEMTPAAQRLNLFNAVQNTYLSTFQVLGGLGLLLGSAGLGVVVLRNVQERRGELALLLAVGFRKGMLQKLVLSEHSALLGLGLGVGVAAAVIGVLPALLSPGSQIPYASLAVTLAAVLLNGLVWTWLATRFALRGRLLEALRSE